jgi:hypothetical protein
MQEPIELEVEFDGPIDLSSADGVTARCPYVYRLVLNGGDEQPACVEQEVLWRHSPQAARRKLYERNKDGLVTKARAFDLQSITKPLSKLLRPNASVISTLAQLRHQRSEKIKQIAEDIFATVYTQYGAAYERNMGEKYLADQDLLQSFNAYVTRLDLGITEISGTKPTEDTQCPEVRYHHRGMEKPMRPANESQGTRHFFRIFPVIFEALRDGGIAIIDEMDSSIHSLLLPEIIGWFWDPDRNPHNAQLWFTCQNPYLLQELTKEEILFTEKDEAGGSAVFSLTDIKYVRRDDNYMKKYLGGAYGALPHFG